MIAQAALTGFLLRRARLRCYLGRRPEDIGSRRRPQAATLPEESHERDREPDPRPQPRPRRRLHVLRRSPRDKIETGPAASSTSCRTSRRSTSGPRAASWTSPPSASTPTPTCWTSTRCCPRARAWATATARWSWRARPSRPADLRGLTIAVPGHDDHAPGSNCSWRIGRCEPVVVPFDEIIERVAAGRVRRRADHPRRPAHLPRRRACRVPEPGPWWWQTTDRRAGRCRWAATPSTSGTARRCARSPTSSRPASATASTTAPRRWTTRWAGPATWAATWPTEFVGMYVNDWTLDYGDLGRAAIRELLAARTRPG